MNPISQPRPATPSGPAHPLPLPVALLLLVALASGLHPASAEDSRLRVRVDAEARLGSAEVLADYLNVQGMARDFEDSFEVGAWRGLRSGLAFGTDSVPLLNDEWYMGLGGIQVFRAAERQEPSWWGPYGPGADLWFSVEEFENYRNLLARELGLADDRISYDIGVTPRVLCYLPDSPDCFSMAPRDYAEWADLMRGIAEYLLATGVERPRLSFFGEPENLYRGKGRATSASPEAAVDYAEHYYVTHEAIRAVLPGALIAGAAHGTASEVLTRELQQNPDQWGLESTLRELDKLDPKFIPDKLTAIAVQGYLFESLEHGVTDFRWAVSHVRGLLEAHGQGSGRHIPILVHGWNGTWVIDPLEIPKDERQERLRLGLEREAAFVVTSTFDFLNPGGERGYDVGFYYTWNLESTCGYPSSMVATVHAADPPWDPSAPHCHTPESAVACVRAPYRAMEMLDTLRLGGDLVATRVDGGDGELVVAATVAAGLRPTRSDLLIAHRRGEPVPALLVELSGLAPRLWVRPTATTITSDLDFCADTVATKLPPVRANLAGRVRVWIPALGAGLIHLAIEPALASAGGAIR